LKSKYKIAFPQMGDYETPISYLLTHLFKEDVLEVPKITSRTIELGCKYSPDFVCTPFKYTLGTFIESLDQGANLLFQAGGGCRYGYYSELQIQILKDLGYEFEYINLVSKGCMNPREIVQKLKKIQHFSLIKAIYYTIITSKMIKYMDLMDDFIRQNIGFEKEKGKFLKVKKEMLTSFKKTKGFFHLKLLYHKYQRKFKKIPVEKKVVYKIGLVGELYTLMEPFANYNLEYELAKFGISVKRYTNVHYLVFEKKKKVKKYLEQNKEYIHYRMGADAADNIAHVRALCEKGYDGIIHMKSSFCTPEIGAMPIINKICKKYDVPVIYFTFDANTSEVGIRTRIEAFYDMIKMRRER